VDGITGICHHTGPALVYSETGSHFMTPLLQRVRSRTVGWQEHLPGMFCKDFGKLVGKGLTNPQMKVSANFLFFAHFTKGSLL
jgi:hypothetical protein